MPVELTLDSPCLYRVDLVFVVDTEHTTELEGNIKLLAGMSILENLWERLDFRATATEVILFAFVDLFVVTRATIFVLGHGDKLSTRGG